MPNRPRYVSGLTWNTVLLALASLFADISTEMLYPVLPIFLTQTLRASGGVVGLIEGLAQATQNLVQGFSGSLSDSLQRRKPIALAGYFLAAVAKPLMGAAGAWPGVLGGRLLDRFGTGVRSAPRDALIAGSASAESRGRAFGLEGLGDNAGAFLGPLLAILLVTGMGVGIRWVFYLAIIPGLLAFLMTLLVKEGRAVAPAEAKIDVSPARFTPAYWKYLAASGLFAMGASSNAFLILRTRELGASLTNTVLIYAGFNLVAALMSYPAGALADRLSRRNVLLVGFVVFMLTYAGFALTRQLAVVALLFGLYGVYQGIFRAVGKALASDFTAEHLRAGAVGWYSAAVGFGGLFASLVAGFLWDHVGHASVFVYGAAVALAGIVAMLVLVTPRTVERDGSRRSDQ